MKKVLKEIILYKIKRTMNEQLIIDLDTMSVIVSFY
jgi:hypothetical protein